MRGNERPGIVQSTGRNLRDSRIKVELMTLDLKAH